MKLFSRDAQHNDLYNRNVMITNKKRHANDPMGKSYKYKVKAVTLIDFGHVRLNFLNRSDLPLRDDGTDAFEPGMYLSPLTMWHEVQRKQMGFIEWVDWEWQPWLEAEYAAIDDATITQAVRERFLPSCIVKTCYERGFKLSETCFWTRKWYRYFNFKGYSPESEEEKEDNNNDDHIKAIAYD